MVGGWFPHKKSPDFRNRGITNLGLVKTTISCRTKTIFALKRLWDVSGWVKYKALSFQVLDRFGYKRLDNSWSVVVKLADHRCLQCLCARTVSLLETTTTVVYLAKIFIFYRQIKWHFPISHFDLIFLWNSYNILCTSYKICSNLTPSAFCKIHTIYTLLYHFAWKGPPCRLGHMDMDSHGSVCQLHIQSLIVFHVNKPW